MSVRQFLLLRFEAPLMSFGGVVVDEHGVTAPFPAQSMITGLLANALGYDHREARALQRLQERVRFGARCDRPGSRLVDYQTVDLGQEFLHEGWTTRGAPAGRAGGTAKTGIHIRYRHYWADAVFTIALTLQPPGEQPDLERCMRAVAEPQRPLFLGRKACLPATPLLLGILEAASIRDALGAAPRAPRAKDDRAMAAWWPVDGEPPPSKGQGRQIPVWDERDWANQVHTGRRFLWESRVEQTDGHGSS